MDPYADSYPASRAYSALQRIDSNALYDILNRAFQHDESDHFECRFCSPAAIDTFLEAFEATTGKRPRGRQVDFVRQADHRIAVLQGPPGTGKTSFAPAPAVLSRLFAAEADNRRLLAVVTAPSHTVVNDAMEDIVTNWREYVEGGGDLAPVDFVRVGGNSARSVDRAVGFVDYYDTDDVSRTTEYLRQHVDDSVTPSDHLIVFTTPTSLRGVVDKCAGSLFGLDSAEDIMDQGHSFVDLLAIDEASMLDLPATLLASAFLDDDSQTLLIGDHRQMEPVQQHDWDGEDRRTIEENVPFMSALNFVRFLRGNLEETEFAFARSPQVGDSIPIPRLDRTYRLHQRVADLLTNLVYTDDGIELRSDRTDTLDRILPRTDGVAAAMNPDAPVTLIVHDEDESQDANRTEVAITTCQLENYSLATLR